jgi:hypothetical protein
MAAVLDDIILNKNHLVSTIQGPLPVLNQQQYLWVPDQHPVI